MAGIYTLGSGSYNSSMAASKATLSFVVAGTYTHARSRSGEEPRSSFFSKHAGGQTDRQTDRQTGNTNAARESQADVGLDSPEW